jgi:aspartate kinase
MEERPVVRGIAHDIDVAKLTVVRVPDKPGAAAAIFGPLAGEHINVDIVVQNVSHEGTTDVSFTVATADLARAIKVVEEAGRLIGAAGVQSADDIGKISVVGSGIMGTPGVFARVLATLAENDINVQMISTGEIRMTCIIARDRVPDAAKALHSAFELDQI